ncbi:MAG: DUF445 family protein [Clostridiales bacterium]|jgi:uncharacterized membrane protein YheB (UPF0754 family)|nr:DUF445 family protein [Clostridiales bacterium]
MFDFQTFLITPVVGAVIGYITNWLAIKMLFLPKEEKRIFGIKIPLTPGLIPKERVRLTKKVAETVSGKLLTPEVLKSELNSQKTSDSMERLLDEMLERLKSSDLTLGDIFEKLTPLLERDEDASLADATTSSPCIPEISLAAEPSFRECDMMENGVGAGSGASEFGSLDSNDPVSVSFADGLPVITDETLIEEEASFHSMLNDSFSSMSASESDIIPEENPVSNIVQESEVAEPELSNPDAPDLPIAPAVASAHPFEEILPPGPGTRFIELCIERLRPQVEERLSAWIASEEFESFLTDGFASFRNSAPAGKAIGDFLPDSVVDSIKSLVHDNASLIAEKIALLIGENEILDFKMTQILDKLIRSNLKFISIFLNSSSIWQQIKSEIYTYIFDETNQAMLVDKMGDLVTSLLVKDASDVLGKIPDSGDWAGKLADSFRSGTIGGVSINDKITELFFDLIKRVLVQLAKTRINGILDAVPEKSFKHVKDMLMSAVQLAIAKGATFIAESMDIEKMVEDKMNGFSIDEAEDVILSVVHNELSVITNLGALLGLMIGLAPAAMKLFGGS